MARIMLDPAVVADLCSRYAIQHILRALGRIEEYTRGMAEDVFMENSLVQDAVIRQFDEQVGGVSIRDGRAPE